MPDLVYNPEIRTLHDQFGDRLREFDQTLTPLHIATQAALVSLELGQVDAAQDFTETVESEVAAAGLLFRQTLRDHENYSVQPRLVEGGTA